MRRHRLLVFAAPVFLLTPLFASAPVAGSGGGNLTPGTQSDAAYIASSSAVSNVFATTQRVSCYTPEVPYFTKDGPNDGYTGMSACNGTATTHEALGPYPTQAGSNSGYPATSPMLVKDHSESDIRVDPTDSRHLIGSSKWIVSAEGYNHLLGFYESFDGGLSWPVQGHIPGYEGWTDNTDPVGAFDTYGDYYELNLPYQFFYNSDGTHNYQINPNNEPNPSQPAEEISVAIRPHGVVKATAWITTRNGQPDFVAPYDSKGQEPDKQWITIDTNPGPHLNTIYAMWAVFDGFNSKVFVSTATALPGGKHTDWSAPQQLPTINGTAGDSYLLPHVAPNGTVYTSVTNFPGKNAFCCVTIAVDWSTDGGQTWQGPSALAAQNIPEASAYKNTTFRQGISNSFAVGNHLTAAGFYPLYVAYEDYGAGNANVQLTMSGDGGQTWSAPIKVNDNATSTVDEFQPNLAVAPDGTVSVNFYDRRLACPAKGIEADKAGLALDKVNPAYSGSLPPYGALNYCVNASIQFFKASLNRIGNNIRLSQHSFDPQLNSPHSGCATCTRTFIGDYFGNTSAGSTSYSSFVSTYDDGTNAGHYQQQVVATLTIP